MSDSAEFGPLKRKLLRLIDQRDARTLVAAPEPAPGFWFGAGKVVRDASGTLWLSGRTRVAGDSRVGLEQGWRGLECSVWRSDGLGRSFRKVLQFSKTDLSGLGARVLSIEGTALHQRDDGVWELFVSFEIERPYPAPFRAYQKPGTGVWVIARIRGATPDALDAGTLELVMQSDQPDTLHVKDPVVFDRADGATCMLYCTHPISWASSNTAIAVRAPGARQFIGLAGQFVPRGPVWDVAVTRVTERLILPGGGVIYFYDGAEGMRALDQNERGLRRPRGYSCEELGGALWGAEGVLTRMSLTEPWFVSPHGTGCSRYVSALTMPEGLLATWQQGQPDGSQPLVGNFLTWEQWEAA